MRRDCPHYGRAKLKARLWRARRRWGLSLLFSALCLAASSGDFVERVEIAGNETVKSKQITKEIAVRAGDVFSEDVLRGDIKRIFDMNKFDDVSVAVSTGVSGVVIRFDVKEKPRLRKFKFVGHKELSAGMLREKLTLSGGDYFSVGDIMNEIRAIQE
ncbi:MAG: hypothetical protein COZ15_06040, partial [Elusimicrobia bacterium CG_4_10_14_3_um_filter_49_12_50_7]